VVALLLAGCAGAPAQPASLTVFAAASLAEPFAELGRQFEASHPGVRVAFNFAGSQQLRAQLEHSAQADVFAPASPVEMQSVIAAGLIAPGAERAFARNRLIVIVPADNPGQIVALADLARPGVKLDLADPAVPVGRYTLDVLGKMSADAAFGAGFKPAVLANVVSQEDNVKSVVSKVRLGEVDAGIVYVSDVAGESAAGLGRLAIPDDLNQVATYPIAPLVKAPQPALAQQFVELILSDAGQQVLARYGFLPAEGK